VCQEDAARAEGLELEPGCFCAGAFSLWVFRQSRQIPAGSLQWLGVWVGACPRVFSSLAKTTSREPTDSDHADPAADVTGERRAKTMPRVYRRRDSNWVCLRSVVFETVFCPGFRRWSFSPSPPSFSAEASWVLLMLGVQCGPHVRAPCQKPSDISRKTRIERRVGVDRDLRRPFSPRACQFPLGDNRIPAIRCELNSRLVSVSNASVFSPTPSSTELGERSVGPVSAGSVIGVRWFRRPFCPPRPEPSTPIADGTHFRRPGPESATSVATVSRMIGLFSTERVKRAFRIEFERTDADVFSSVRGGNSPRSGTDFSARLARNPVRGYKPPTPEGCYRVGGTIRDRLWEGDESFGREPCASYAIVASPLSDLLWRPNESVSASIGSGIHTPNTAGQPPLEPRERPPCFCHRAGSACSRL